MDLTQRFAELHQGRRDIYGAIEGRCVREPLTFEHWHSHLHGDGSVGLYPLISERTDERAADIRKAFKTRYGVDGGAYWVHLGCTDIDHPDGPDACWTQARNLVKALKALGITSWPERTKGKGWHVWIFADEWVPAVVMRRALLAAHQIAGVAPTEVNPKSVEGGKQGNGNYINAGYAKAWADEGRRVVVALDLGSFYQDGEPLGLEHFVDQALANRTPFTTLYEAAALYKEPPKRTVGEFVEPDGSLEELTRDLPGLAWTIFTKGVLEGRDRSSTMMRFCHLCAEHGIPPGNAKRMLRDLDSRLGKFVDRSDCEEQLDKMITSAYSKVRT